MRLAGKPISGANVETIVLPRGQNDPIVLHAQAILDYTPFDQLCPQPKPPSVLKRGGLRETNPEDPTYQAALQGWGQKRMAWLVITSLRLGTPDLEWETVDYGQPETWIGYEKELKGAGFSEIEIGRILRACMVANALDDDKLEEARNAFLASQARPGEPSSSPKDEPNSTPSGGPANASA